MSIAVFDLDKTLTKRTTSLTVGTALLREGIIPKVDFFKYFAKYFISSIKRMELKKEDLRKMVDESMILFTNKKIEDFERVIETSLRSNIERLTYKKTRDLLELERLKGKILILATSAPKEVARVFAQELKFDHFVATEFLVRDGRLTGLLKNGLCHGENKLLRVEELLESIDKKNAEITFFSDSSNDLPLFKRAQGSVAINPDGILKKFCINNNISYLFTTKYKRIKYTFITVGLGIFMVFAINLIG